MLLLTSQEMRRLDDLSIRRDKIPSIRLMENAGGQIFRVIRKKYHPLKGKKIYIFCGPGNNGGDGMVVARLLKGKGARVFVFIVSDPDRLKGDPLIEFKKIKKTPHFYAFVKTLPEIKKIYTSRDKPNLIVDALFGTGLSRPLKGVWSKLIGWLNSQKTLRLSIDIPSGLCSDTGKVLGKSFVADDTITLGFPKLGFFLNQAADYVGILHVVPIGLSPKAINETKSKVHLISCKDIESLLRKRSKTSHKGTFGHSFVVGCSLGKIGAGIMAAHTALRAGAGLSTLILPISAFKRIDTSALEIMYEPISGAEKGFFVEKNLSKVLSLVRHADVVALGPGIGTERETTRFVQKFVEVCKVPLVIDADGLNAIAKRPEILKKRKQLTLLTPHPGEMSRLLKKTTRYIQTHRLESATSFAKKYGVAVLLKGYRSLLALPNGDVWVNPTGNPAMASAGQGDVLTGIYAGLLAQASSQRGGEWERGRVGEFLLFGCFLHGLVGDLLAQKNRRVVLATDIEKNLDLGYSFLRKNSEVLSSVFY